MIRKFAVADAATVFAPPFAQIGIPAPGEIGSQDGTCLKDKILLPFLLNKVGELVLNLFIDHHRGCDLARAVAQGALLRGPDFLKDKLLSLKKEEATDDKIFHFNPNQLTDNFCAAREKLGFKFRLHDLRHYYASVMLRLNTPDKYAMKRMGHSTPTMLKRVYQHLMEEKEREVDQSIRSFQECPPRGIQHKERHRPSPPSACWAGYLPVKAIQIHQQRYKRSQSATDY